MSRRWIQSLCIVVLFLLAFAAVVILGIDQGHSDRELKNHGISLDEKTAWEDALAKVSQETDPTVYVTESGAKYHLYSDCSALKRAKNVIGILRSSAEDAGKELCSICAKS